MNWHQQSQVTSQRSINPKRAGAVGQRSECGSRAHDAYLQGRYFFNRPSDENLKKAIERFEVAVKLDPNFAPAFSGLSDAYLWAGYNEGVHGRGSQAQSKGSG